MSQRTVASLLVAAVLASSSCSTNSSAAAPTTETTTSVPATVPAPLTSSDTNADPDTTATTADGSTDRALISPPRQVVIPAIEVDATIIDLGLTTDGALETPTDFAQAGWWAGGTVADAPGPTVIVGHVDDHRGPAVFFRLQELEPGDTIVIHDALERDQVFTVVDKGLYDKEAFPTERVYGASDQPTLRLITCGGAFDQSVRSYESNWVIYAVAGSPEAVAGSPEAVAESPDPAASAELS